MGRRGHRNRRAGGVEAQGPAAAQDRGELTVQPRLAHRTEVEPEVVHPQLLHTPRQGAAHLVAGGQITAGQLGYRAGPGGIAEAGSLSPHRFADQEVGGAGEHQRCGVELHEFEIAHRRSGAPGHRHPVTAGLGRVGGVGEQMAATAAGQNHRPGPQPAQPVAIENLQTHAAAPLHPELQGRNALVLLQANPSQHVSFQSIHQGTSGPVLGVQNPPVAVGRLQGRAQLISLPVEGHSQLQQPRHTVRGIPHQQLHRLEVAEAGAGLQGVVDVALEAVLGPGHRSNSALGPAAGGGGAILLAEEQHPQAGWQFKAGHQAGGAAAHHHHIPVGGQIRMLHRQAPLERAYGSTAINRFGRSRPIKKTAGGRRFRSLVLEAPEDQPGA